MASIANDPIGLPAQTSIGRVRLTVSDLDRALSFYRDLLGLHLLQRNGPQAVLGAAPDGKPLVILEELPGAIVKPRGTTGLYHFALLMPSRRELARVFRRLLEASWPFQGFSDHGVSEALYLADADGNGIELYADRPREDWPRQNGSLVMYTRPLDIEDLLAQWTPAPGEPDQPSVHPDTCVGHIHLHVADLDRAEAFYHGLIGFDVMFRNYPGARFLSAGGYHHHLGINIWAGQNAPPPPANSTGLLDFAIQVPDAMAASFIVDRLRRAGISIEEQNSPFSRGWLVHDPDHIGVLICTGEC